MPYLGYTAQISNSYTALTYWLSLSIEVAYDICNNFTQISNRYTKQIQRKNSRFGNRIELRQTLLNIVHTHKAVMVDQDT